MLNNCLICCKKNDLPGMIYHKKCSKSFFGSEQFPQLPYALDELSDLAKKIVRSSITVPGVQTKLSLNIEKQDQQWDRFTLVGLWGKYILKPPVEKYPGMPELEHITMHLANSFNIKTVPYGLISLKSGELAYITKRIDRGGQKKIHMEDMCQLSERLTEDKYKGSMEQVGKIIRHYSSLPGLDLMSFFELVLFCFLCGNADMHLKNFSLIYNEKGGVSLAPAYDLLSTRMLIPEKDDPEEMALTLNGKKARFKRSDFETFAKSLGLSGKQTENAFLKFLKGYEKFTIHVKSGFINSTLKKAYMDLFSQRLERIKVM